MPDNEGNHPRACFNQRAGRNLTPAPDGAGVGDYIHVIDLIAAHLLALSSFRYLGAHPLARSGKPLAT